jgi:hypothetical protein
VTRSYQAAQAGTLPYRLAARLSETPSYGHALRVAVDGPRCADPVAFAETLVEPLRVRGHDVTVIDARSFWRDASLRLEYGRQDLESFGHWVDDAALRREVLDPLGTGGSGRFLPSLRNPDTNRSTRAESLRAGPGQVVMLAGELLLGLDLPFDTTVHLAVSPAARVRRTEPEWAWTLPAWTAYDAEVAPAAMADIAIRLDDPYRPAISWAADRPATSR